MNKFALLAIVCAVVPAGIASGKGEKQEDLRKSATTQIEQAISKTNIFDLPSFQMTAQVQIQTRGKFADGSYQFLWNGPDQWKEEIALPGYTEVQIGGKGTVTIRRSTDFLPLGISALHAALGFGSGAEGGARRFGSLVQSGLAPTDVIKKIHSRKEHGDLLSCMEVEDEQRVSSEMCVNDTMGVLVRNSSFADKDFQPFAGKVFPRFLSFLEDGETVAKIKISGLTTPGQFPPESFAPLAGVSPLAGCMNPVPARIVKKVPPEYPEFARRARVQGRVGIDAWIGADGIPKVGQVVAHVSPDLDQSAINAISQWRYEPAACGGKRVAVETVLSIKYSLSY